MAATRASGKSVIDIIVSEHKKVDTLYWEYKNSEDVNVRQNKIYDIIKELSEHAAKEEMVVYPLMKEKLPNGEKLVDHALEEHQEVKNQLFEIDSMTLEKNPEVAGLFAKCIAGVQHHVKEEERDLLPSLQRACSHAELVEVGVKYTNAAMRAPSRPHPSAPNEGLRADAANLMSKPLDAARDMAREMGKKDKKSEESDVGGKQLENPHDLRGSHAPAYDLRSTSK